MRNHLLPRPLAHVFFGIVFSTITIAVLPVSPAVAAEMPATASAILREAHGDPNRLPSITAEAIVSQRETLRNAAPIVGAVVAGAPLLQASRIASAIGAEFHLNPQLAEQAPEIAAAVVRALLGKLRSGASYSAVRNEIAESVAALSVMLPGTVQANRERIARMGQAVAGAVGPEHGEMSSAIVASTSTALKAVAGSSNISSILGDFQGAFSSISNSSNSNNSNTAGNSGNTSSGEGQQASGQPGAGATGGNIPLSVSYFSDSAVRNSATMVMAAGSVVAPETNVQNQ